VDQIKRWFDYFPRDQFSIIKSEDFFADEVGILHETQAFLGVGPHNPVTLKVHHQSEQAGMDPVMRRRLAEYFAPFNQQLYDLLDRDFGWEHE
jgi:hypothetical protein